MFPSLEYFLCIVKHNNITRAAEELHITQQSLSNYLKRLEEYFGLPLFTRKPNLALTPTGAFIYERACQIQHLTAEMDTLCFYYRNFKTVSIGFTPIHIHQAPELLNIELFNSTHPDVSLQINNSRLRGLARDLANRQLDMYIASYVHNPKVPTVSMEPAPDYVQKKIGSCSFHIIIHPQLLYSRFGDSSNRLIRKWKDGVDIKELSHIPLVLLEQLKTLLYLDSTEREYPLRLALESYDVQTVVEVVSRGYGFAVVPHRSHTKYPELLEFPLTAPNGLCVRDVFCVSTETALQRTYVKDLWDTFPPFDEGK